MINFSNILTTLFPDIIPVKYYNDEDNTEINNENIIKDVNETKLTVNNDAVNNDTVNNDTDNCGVSLNGKALDLTKKEDVEKAKTLLNDLRENQLMKWMFNENELDELISNIDAGINNIYYQNNPDSCDCCSCNCRKDELNLEDDGNYIANVYLEDIIDNWHELCIEDKKRYMNVISDFYHWLEKKSNCNG